MDYIMFAFDFLAVLLIIIIIIKIWMIIANYISEQLGIGKFFYKLIMKLRKSRHDIKS